jgi:hypothetical protein
MRGAVARNRFHSHTEARMAVFHFIEGFYNPIRLRTVPGHGIYEFTA